MEAYKIIPVILFFIIGGILFFSFYNPAPKFEFSNKNATTEGTNENSCTITLDFALSNFGTSANNITVMATVYGADKETLTNEYLDIGKMKNGDAKKFKKVFSVLLNCELVKGVDLSISSYEVSGI